MFRKGLVAFFAILLAVVCLIELTPTFYSSWIENKALNASNGTDEDYKSKLDSFSKDTLDLGLKSYTYSETIKNQMNLGLDLKGGINVMLEVSQKDLIKELADNTTNPFFNEVLTLTDEEQKSSNRPYIDDFFTIFYAKRSEKGLNLPLANADIFGTQNLRQEIKFNTSDKDVEEIIRREVEKNVASAYEIIRTRIDKFGAAQPNVQRVPGSGRIMVELPGATETDRIKKILQTSARLEFWEVYNPNEIIPYLENFMTLQVDSTKKAQNEGLRKYVKDLGINGGLFSTSKENIEKVNQIFLSEKALTKLPGNLKKARFMWSSKPDEKTENYVLYVLKANREGKATMEGSVEDAGVGVDEFGRVVVSMRMDAKGTADWGSLTQKNVGKPIAIVLDNMVYSAPSVNEPILTGSSQISGNFSQEEAKDLVDVLKSGKLPATAKIVQAEQIGATLGKESVQNGFYSFVVAFFLIMIWMIVYYGRAGFYANLALIANLFFIVGIMASKQFTLTLPGIAGIVLTLGMAVDANIIIFERIKEELRLSKSIQQAVNEGQKHALSAIIDGNLTTVITAIILLIFGSGPIEGFAVTLIIGIICTLFTAILLTRLFIQIRLDNKKDISFWTFMSKNWFNNINWDWMGRRKIAYTISGIITILGLISLTTQGLNFGVDYTGGRTYNVRVQNITSNAEEISKELSIIFNEGVDSKVDVKPIGTDGKGFKITTKYKIDNDDVNVDSEIQTKLYTGLKKYLSSDISQADFNNGSLKNQGIMSSIKVGPTIADDIQVKGFYAVGFALLGIFLYILLRFRKWEFSFGAVVALFHDALVVLSIFSIFYKFSPFSLEIDQAFIAAILTVIGYSINDSVIVFDRIRENLNLHRLKPLKIIFNDSVNQTLGRTFNTSFTTLLVVLVIFIFGGESIRGFMFALLVGIGVGTYSSTFVASALTYDLLKDKVKNREK